MQPITLLILAIACPLAFPTAASAGPLQNRLNRQDRRIFHGVQNGSISGKEYRRLDRRADKLQAKRYRNVRDGGGLTFREGVRLNRALNRQSKTIYRAKYN